MQQNLPFLAVCTYILIHLTTLVSPLDITDAAMPVKNSQCTCVVHISRESGHLRYLHPKMLQVGEAPKAMCRSQQQFIGVDQLVAAEDCSCQSQLRAATCGWILGTLAKA